ncbi:MAG: transposase [Kiritimatiellia bacterium]
MARPLRIQYEGAIYHVTVRGNGRKTIFRTDKDRRALCRRLEESVASYGVRIYLYCLMDNHFHLVVDTPRGNLTRFMQSILTSYTIGYNLRNRHCGHVTQGRYGARLVAGNDYLLKLSRYVHLNPVQVKSWNTRPLAERTAALREHRWSSYRAYIGADPPEAWVSYRPLKRLIAGEGPDADREYERYVEAGLVRPDDEFLDEMMRSPRSIGAEEYREWVEEQHRALMKSHERGEDVSFRPAEAWMSPEHVLEAVAARWRIGLPDLSLRRRGCPSKGVAAWLLEKHAGLTRRAIGPLLGIESGTGVGYQIRQAMDRIKYDPHLARRVEKIERVLEKMK